LNQHLKGGSDWRDEGTLETLVGEVQGEAGKAAENVVLENFFA
jgi:hypothetical protein